MTRRGLLAAALLVLTAGCASHLQDAKWFFTEAQRLDRAYRIEAALAAYRRSRIEAEAEIKKSPSAQAYMLKGLAEMKLEMWSDAEESFLAAFDYGFDQGEEWARQLSLLGLAAALQEMGLEHSALTVYRHLLERSKLPAVTVLAAQRYADTVLARSLLSDAEDREDRLQDLLKTVERLTERDLACGTCHYLQSQILSHLGDHAAAFEHAVMARELGLPSLAVLRDNDNLIIFIYRSLRDTLPAQERERFLSLYRGWIEKWGWKGPETPDWQTR